jgi:two-component system, cell cycle response regulator DivK
VTDAASPRPRFTERRLDISSDRRMTRRGGRRADDEVPSGVHFTPENAPLVLVVDDYADGRELTSHYLRARGFKIAEAATGREAIEAALVLRPDLMLLDLVLPDADGWQVISRLRQDDNAKRIKIAIHTASVTAAVRQLAHEHNVDAFFPRPCDLALLASQLVDLIGAADRLSA